MAKERKRRTGGDGQDSNRSISKRKGIEKQWRKGTARWKFDGDSEGELHHLDYRRGAPRKFAIVIDGAEREGVIIQTGGPIGIVRDTETGNEYRAKPRRSTTTENANSTLVAVGDRVRYIIADEESSVISHIYARSASLSRRSIETSGIEQVLIANIDQVGIVVAASVTMLKPGLIDRYIIAAAMGGMEPFICVNKIDLADEETLDIIDEIREVYETAGYTVIYTSCFTGEGLDTLTLQLQDKSSVFSGHSGVGKTSLLNAMIPGLEELTMELSDQSQRGIHTTSRSTMYELPRGGFLTDTPGIREFGLFHFDSNDLHTYYPEFIEYADRCRFAHCTHVHEPGCAVKEAVDAGGISDLRYDNYLQILSSEEEYVRKW